MNSLTNKYRQIIRKILEEYADFLGNDEQVKVELVLDEKNDRKVWIQHDGTEEGIANDLVVAGIPKGHIILGFKSPEIRKYTEFAVF
jgi:hypothetical protein